MKINNIKYLNKIFQIILGVILIFSICENVYAYSFEDIDLEKKGSINITLKYNEERIEEGSLELYKVATIQNDGSGNIEYVFSEEFKAFDTSAVEAINSADKLETYVKENGITGIIKNVDLEGKITYDNLELGIYLIRQVTSKAGYYPIKSFIVTVPEEINEQVIYDVEALPKMDIIKEIQTPDDMSHTKINQPTTDTHNKSGDKVIPQTGFMLIPIIVIFVIGVILLIPGYITKKKDEKDDNNSN